MAILELHGAPGTSIVISASELADADPAALVTRLASRLRRFEERKATTITDAEHARREIDLAAASLGKSFPWDVDLHKARERVRDAELEQMAEAARTPAEAATEEGREQQDSTRSREPQTLRRLSGSSLDQAGGRSRATGPQAFIEQSFIPCSDDPEGSAAPSSTADECYSGPVLTLSLNGTSTPLVCPVPVQLHDHQHLRPVRR